MREEIDARRFRYESNHESPISPDPSQRQIRNMDSTSSRRMPSAESFRMIGQVAWSWAMMETLLRSQLVRLAVGPKKQRARDVIPPYLLVVGMKVHTVLGLLRSFVSRQFPETDLTVFDKIRQQIERLNDKRDLIVHSAWKKGVRPDSIRVLRVRSVHQIRQDTHEFTVQELGDIAMNIREQAQLLVKFFEKRGLAFDFRETDERS